MARRLNPTDEPLLTIEEYERLPPDPDGYQYELVRGRLVREPAPGAEHGLVDTRVIYALERWCRAAGAGVVMSNAGFALRVDPDTVRAPDVAFVTAARMPAHGYGGSYWRMAPDLAVEIISPSNRRAALSQQVRDYLEAGSRMVWVVDSARRAVTIHETGVSARTLSADDMIDGGDVLPDFSVRVAEFFV
jgi:Uma2 family endonuclease